MLKVVLVRILYKLNLLKWFSLTVNRDLYGKTYRIPQKGNVGYKNLFEWDAWMVPILEKVKAGDGLFIDIGSNIGQTLLKYKSLSSKNNYIGVEPNPHCVAYLNELISVNDFNAVKIIPKAISSKKEHKELTLYQNDPTDGMASLVPEMRPHNTVSNKIKIETISGDEFSKELDSKVHCIKIDVEGAELEVLENIDFLLVKDRPYIIIEILPVYQKENVLRYNNQMEIEAILKKHGYEIYLIKNLNSKFDSLVHKPNFGIHSNIDLVDYLLIPSEKVNAIID